MGGAGHARQKRVLVVDDDYFVSDLLLEALTEWGYAVDVAASARLLARQLEISPPDLIILDINLPGMDGTEIGYLLRSNPHTAKIPVLMLSADRRVEQKATRVKTDDWMAKPVDLELLAVKVHRLLALELGEGSGA